MPLIHEILQKTSVEFPDKEAVVCGDIRLSYSHVEDASTCLAGFLQAQGVEPGDRVGLFTNKGVEEVIAIFAILKAGAAFVHINPQFKKAHLTHVVSDCDIKTLFVDCFKSAILSKAFANQNPLELIVSLSPTPSLDPETFYNIHTLDDILRNSPPRKVRACNNNRNDHAAIVYTSGSTGMPKGVIITHQIVCEAAEASVGVLQNNQHDRLICVTPLSFDGALSQLFSAFLVGGTLVQQKSSFPSDIVRTLQGEKITGFHGVPSLWNMMLQPHSPLADNYYPDLKYVSIIGESFPWKYLSKLKEILAGTRIYMMYGTTEAFRSTYLPPEQLDSKPSSVGLPFPGVEISVVDDQGELCQPGLTGEIVHRGAFVSPGYWKNQESTAEVFRNGAVYTGDLGKLDEEGFLYFMARRDGMIKTNGYRVSPEEIERCIHELDQVDEVAAVGVSEDGVGIRIRAIVVCKQGISLSHEEIIRHCRNRLPAYMIPQMIKFRSHLPKTATSKIDRHMLIQQED